jgi:uncharacterized protein (DUF1501 family)
MSDTTRRGFLVGCSAAIAGYAGSRFNTISFGAPGSNTNDILVHVFLRGGMDGLNLIPPIGGADRGHYESARPDLQVPAAGAGAALNLGGGFGIHPSASSLFDLYQDNKLSIVHAVGFEVPNRSHFDAMQFIELGSPTNSPPPDGWLTRHLATSSNVPTNVVMPALAIGTQQASLQGNFDAINMSNPDSFRLNTGPSQWRSAQRKTLRNLLNNGGSWLHQTGLQSLDALDVIELNVSGGYNPANGAVYPGGTFGDHLETVARMIKLDLGLQVATIDLGGWDTHNGQGNGSGGYFAGLVQQLSDGLANFYLDLDGAGGGNYTNRLTVIVQSEFGRRLRQNDDNGTDHGHGNTLMVLSGNALGGLHGAWPGLDNGQLFDGADVAVTTDYRRVLSEILIRRLGNNNIGEIFPGYQDYSPLGLVDGVDLPPILGPEIFADGFDSGDFSGWGNTAG